MARSRREALTVVALSVGNSLAGVAANRLLTDVANPTALGSLYLQLNVALWVTLPVAGGYTYVSHHWAIARQLGKTRLLARGLTTALTVQSAIAVTVALALPHWPAVGVGGGIAAVAFAGVCIGQACAQALGIIPALDRRRLLGGFVDFCSGPARLVALAAGAACLASHPGLGSLLEIHGLYSVFLLGAVCLAFRSCLRRSSPQPDVHPAASPAEGDPISIRAFLHYCLPSLAATLGAHAASSVERWSLAGHDGPASMAMLVQASGLALSGVNAVAGVITSYYYPLITQAAARGDDPVCASRPVLARYLLATASVLGVAVVIAVACAPLATRLVFGSSYAAASRLLPWTVLAAALFAMGQALSVVLLTARATIAAAVARVGSVGAYVVALLALSPGEHSALGYARIQACCQLLYIAAVIVLIGVNRARLAEPSGRIVANAG
jgi:hypothetical protein